MQVAFDKEISTVDHELKTKESALVLLNSRLQALEKSEEELHYKSSKASCRLQLEHSNLEDEIRQVERALEQAKQDVQLIESELRDTDKVLAHAETEIDDKKEMIIEIQKDINKQQHWLNQRTEALAELNRLFKTNKKELDRVAKQLSSNREKRSSMIEHNDSVRSTASSIKQDTNDIYKHRGTLMVEDGNPLDSIPTHDFSITQNLINELVTKHNKQNTGGGS